MSKKPKVLTRCPANVHTEANERVVEVSFGDGASCLISLRSLENGKHRIEIYRADPEIQVIAPAPRADGRRPKVSVRSNGLEETIDITFPNGAGAVISAFTNGDDIEQNVLGVTKLNHTIDVRTYDFSK